MNSRIGRKPSSKEREHVMNIPLLRGQEKKKKKGSAHVQVRKDRIQKPQKVEPIVKEEGEMSDDEEVYEQFKEVKWMEWCQDVMVEEMKTLKRLHRLQTTSANLPKEKVSHGILSFIMSIWNMFTLFTSPVLYRFFQKYATIYNFLGER